MPCWRSIAHGPRALAQAIGAGAGGDEAKQPETDFVRDDPQWLAEAAAMTDDFMATPAVEHLAQGRLGVPFRVQSWAWG